MNPLLWAGLEEILKGILVPFFISLGVSVVRIALFGWHGIRHYMANLTVGIFGGTLADWILQYYDVPMNIRAPIISVSALISWDAMRYFFSRKTLGDIGGAATKRICHEILHRGAPRSADESRDME